MSKSSASKNDRVETVRSELYRCVYVTAYDEVALTNYLVQPPSQNYAIMNINVEEELNERRNGGDLDDDGEDARYFDNTMREV